MKRPNILLITSDQQHHDTIGKFNSKIQTPSLDRLCNEGMNFTRAYCPSPVCTPCLLYTSPSPRDRTRYRMPSSA